MQAVLEKLFTVSLILSVLLALTMIFGQIIGLISGNGELVTLSSEWLKRPTIILAAIFSGIAFVLGYFPAYKDTSGN